MNDDTCIRVWPWGEAPTHLQERSTHGGDEDWVALVPLALKGISLPWAWEGTNFGCCSVSVIDLEDGTTLYIGAHA